MGFGSKDFTFIVMPASGGSIVGADSLTHVFESFLGRRLIESDRLPADAVELCASWLLARLCALEPLIPAESDTRSDGAGYCLDVAVASGDAVVGAFQVQGDVAGVAVFGRSCDSETGDAMLAEFADVLLADPNQLAVCCYRVVDPEWEMEPDCFDPTPEPNSKNEFGWQEGRYLGVDNIREE